MRKISVLAILILLTIKSYSQTKNFIDQPYIATQAKVDSLVVPDRIYLTIILDEANTRNKKSTEDLENEMRQVLTSLHIDINNDLSLLDYNSNFKKYFLSSQKIHKTKMYSLLVRDASTAGKVLTELEKADISNVSIEKTTYSKSEELLLNLKTKAIVKAKRNAEIMVNLLNQKVKKAIFISDVSSISNQLQGRVAGIKIRGQSSIYGSRASEPLIIDFDKITFSSNVEVKFAIE